MDLGKAKEFYDGYTKYLSQARPWRRSRAVRRQSSKRGLRCDRPGQIRWPAYPAAAAMSWRALLTPFSDPYERKARGLPGLLAVLPLLVLLCCARGIDRLAPTAFLTLLSAGGGITALAAVARVRGKGLEQRMVRHWGGLPTTLALRHRSGHYNAYSLAHIHRRLQSLTGLSLPTSSDEHADPADADARYAAATDRLRHATRGAKFPHLRRENIAYGFYRNALALKPIGLLTCALGVAGGALLGGIFGRGPPPGINLDRLLAPGVAAGVAITSSLVLALLWLCLTRSGLKRVGLAYADRLFECLDTLPAAGRIPKNKGIHHES